MGNCMDMISVFACLGTGFYMMMWSFWWCMDASADFGDWEEWCTKFQTKLLDSVRPQDWQVPLDDHLDEVEEGRARAAEAETKFTPDVLGQKSMPSRSSSASSSSSRPTPVSES